jgi:hypothetical protein
MCLSVGRGSYLRMHGSGSQLSDKHARDLEAQLLGIRQEKDRVREHVRVCVCVCVYAYAPASVCERERKRETVGVVRGVHTRHAEVGHGVAP